VLEHGIDLAACTVLVGENGSGKSTLVEALAMAAGMNAEGGSTGATHRTHTSESPLHEWVTVVRDPGAPRWGYFVRAETMHGLFTWLDTNPGPTDPSFHTMSHGESFVTLLGTRRFRGEGLFVLDEPEAGLSFSAQLHLVAELTEMARRPRTQVVLATHSPVLAAIPGASVLELGEHGIRSTTWDELDVVVHHRSFLAEPRRYLRHVLDDFDDSANDLLTEQTHMIRFGAYPTNLGRTSAMAQSKARNTDPRYSKLTIGVCPDQWGVWFPQDEKQIDWDVALDEMATAGFSVMETGPFGYFPTDPARLKEEMDARGFRVVAGTGWGILHKAEAWAETERFFREIAETHAAVGAEYVVHLPPMFRDEKTGAYTDDRVLSTEAWNLYIKNADRLGRIMKEDYGLKMVLHPHGDSHIETPADIDRIFQATDPEYVGFCLDTGHIVYGDGDPMELCRTYPERISYVHIKAMDPVLVKQAHDEDWPFVKAVHAGCSVTPPAGLPDMGDLIEALADLDKELYVVCEQDMYGCDKDFPLPNAIKTREYLASLGLGLA